jgi:hypothetical protein
MTLGGKFVKTSCSFGSQVQKYAFTNDEAKESAVQAVVDLMCHNSVGTVELESISDK